MTPSEIASRASIVRERIDPYIRTTPLELLTHPGRADPAYIKCEHLQVTGSFKVRGALSRLTGLTEAERQAGVVTASTGNHGAAVAYGGFQLGIETTVFVPESADPSKLENMKRWGASVVEVAGDPIEAEVRARATSESDGRVYVSPYNDLEVISGQATIGLELVSQLDHADSVIVSVGGGGLISGIAAVLKERWPHLRAIGCAATNTKVMMESVAAGRQLHLPSLPSLSDGTAGGVEEGSVTFPLCQALVDEWIDIDEEAIGDALVGYLKTHHQLIEGSAAMAIAAWKRLVENGADLGTTVVVSCGANVDPSVLPELLGSRA